MATTIKLRARYELTEASRIKSAVAGNPLERYQVIEIEVDTEQAIERGLAYIGDDGRIYQKFGPGSYAGGPQGESWPLNRAIDPFNYPSGIYKADHVLTQEEAIERYYALYAEHISAICREKAKEEKLREELAHRIALLLDYLHNVPSYCWEIGVSYTGAIDYVRVEYLSNSCELKYNEMPKEITVRLHAELNRRKRVEEEDAEEAKKIEKAEAEKRIAERDSWIKAHGSDRLRKGLEAGVVRTMGGVYRSERVKVELGQDWKLYDEVEENRDEERINPSEAEIDALLEAQKKWPSSELEVSLRSVRYEVEEYDELNGAWHSALMMRLPWERDIWAIRFL